MNLVPNDSFFLDKGKCRFTIDKNGRPVAIRKNTVIPIQEWSKWMCKRFLKWLDSNKSYFDHFQRYYAENELQDCQTWLDCLKRRNISIGKEWPIEKNDEVDAMIDSNWEKEWALPYSQVNYEKLTKSNC